jgi:gliding motility-associated-like protein
MLMPNAFSPNDDNKNDVLKPIYACDLMPENYSLTIYNRWGDLLFQTTDFNIGWDGTFKSKPQPIAAYVYLLQYKFNNQLQILKGDVELVR